MNSFIRKIKASIGKKIQTEVPVNPILQPHYETLDQRMQGAIHFLGHQHFQLQGKKTSLKQLPWFLLIGSPNSGKTSLLYNSDIKFVLDKINKKQASTESCDWWASTHAIYVDIPGKYIFLKAKKISLANKLWEFFINKIVEYRGSQGIDGVIVTLSIEEMFNTSGFKSQIETFTKRIIELQNRFGGDLPFYLILTKCDLLPGFIEFFNEYTREELLQAWGIPLKQYRNSEEFLQVFDKRFDQLIKRLNDQVITRLHQERNLLTKYYIKDFPLQIETLKQKLSTFLKALLDASKMNLCLKGIYLTSSLQTQESSYLAEQREIVLANQYQQALQLFKTPPPSSRPYFIKQLFVHHLLPRTRKVWTHLLSRERLPYAAAILVSASVFLWSAKYIILPNRIHTIVLADTKNQSSIQSRKNSTSMRG